MDVPLIVFVNTKSGGLQGTKIIDKFKKCIPSENVFDLSRDGPMPGYVPLLYTTMYTMFDLT